MHRLHEGHGVETARQGEVRVHDVGVAGQTRAPGARIAQLPGGELDDLRFRHA